MIAFCLLCIDMLALPHRRLVVSDAVGVRSEETKQVIGLTQPECHTISRPPHYSVPGYSMPCKSASPAGVVISLLEKIMQDAEVLQCWPIGNETTVSVSECDDSLDLIQRASEALSRWGGRIEGTAVSSHVARGGSSGSSTPPKPLPDSHSGSRKRRTTSATMSIGISWTPSRNCSTPGWSTTTTPSSSSGPTPSRRGARGDGHGGLSPSASYPAPGTRRKNEQSLRLSILTISAVSPTHASSENSHSVPPLASFLTTGTASSALWKTPASCRWRTDQVSCTANDTGRSA